jgi:hypothetical protein
MDRTAILLGKAGAHHSRATLLILLFSALANAQTTGEVSGRILDASQSVIPKVNVAVTNTGTGSERRLSTADTGEFTVTFLPPGIYEVSASAAGFKTARTEPFTVGAGQRVQVSLNLSVADVAETVTVSGSVTPVNTEDGKIRHVIEQKQAQNLALNGRVLTHMLALVPGVAVVGDLNALDITGSLGNYSVNGSRTVFNTASIDGGYNQDSGAVVGQSNLISPDFVQEVSIVTSGYSAEYGRHSGVNINFATRSGTKEFHGTAYEFFRNNALDARSFFVPGVQKLRFNNFGWTVGGPVTIPGVFNRGRNKLFFFAGQEYRRRVRDTITFATTPTSAERAGIINSRDPLVYPANFPIADLRGQRIADPSRATPQNPGGLNIIPRQYITQNARAINGIWETMIQQSVRYVDEPSPNNTVFQLPVPDNRREDFIKADVEINERQRVAYTWMYGPGYGPNPFVFGPYPTKGFVRRNLNTSHRLALTSILSPQMVNKVMAQVNHTDLRWPPLGDFDRAQRYGLAPKELFGNDIQELGIPTINIQGFSTISGAAGPWQAPTADFSVMNDFNYVRGRHNFKAGILFFRNRKNEAVLETSRFLMAQVDFVTQGNTNTSGNALADLLLGNFRSWREAEATSIVGVRVSHYEWYVTDNWKLARNFNLDLGLRTTHAVPNYAAANNISTFDPAFYRADASEQVIPSGPGAGSLRPGVGVRFNGMVIPGDGFLQNFDRRFPAANTPEVKALFRGLPQNIYGNYSVVVPRLGFAWDALGNGRLAVRGGAGMFTDMQPTGFFREHGSNPPFGNVVEVIDGPFDDPSRGSVGSRFPVTVLGTRRNLQPPVTYKANLGFQLRTPLDAVLDINYVTSQGRRLLRRVDINTVHPSTQLANRTVSLNALRPYQGYASILMYESSAASNYHGLQTGWSRRFSRGVSFSLSYTYSKALDDASALAEGVEDPTNYRNERSHSLFDRRHVATISYIWEMPFWRSGSVPLYQRLLGGWTLSGISQFQTGAYLTPLIQTPTGVRRPDRIGDLTYLEPRQLQTLTGGDGLPRTGNFWFNPGPGGAFVAPPSDRFGNSAPRIVRGPGRNNWNLALIKTFPVYRERVRMNFRAEAFNIWNHAQFNNPNLVASDRNFGTITSAVDGRNLQLGLKLEF